MIESRKNPKFGEIAVSKGFATAAQVDEALAIQARLRSEGSHELIGIIMLQEGMLTNEQLIEILRVYDHGEP